MRRMTIMWHESAKGSFSEGECEKIATAGPASAPVEIEADTDAFVVDPVGGDFVAQPAFEEDDVTGLGGVGDVRAVAGFAVGASGWGGHEALEPRIFKFEAGATRRCGDVVSAADEGEWVQVERMRRGRRHDVNPAIGHADGATAQVELEGAGVSAGMAE